MTHKRENMYDFSDPYLMGPGMWFYMHLSAAHAETVEERKLVCKQIRLLCQFMKCQECSGHCKEFISHYPPENAVVNPNDLFKWTIDFRNTVQRRLGRTNIYDETTMYDLFHDTNFMTCNSGCGGGNNQSKIVILEDRNIVPSRLNEIAGKNEVIVRRKINPRGY